MGEPVGRAPEPFEESLLAGIARLPVAEFFCLLGVAKETVNLACSGPESGGIENRSYVSLQGRRGQFDHLAD